MINPSMCVCMLHMDVHGFSRRTGQGDRGECSSVVIVLFTCVSVCVPIVCTIIIHEYLMNGVWLKVGPLETDGESDDGVLGWLACSLTLSPFLPFT